MVVDESVIARHLTAIAVELEHARELVKGGPQGFHHEWRTIRLAERVLQLIAQSVIDVAGHIIAQKRWTIPGSYSDSVTRLSEHGLIERDLAQRLAELVSMRNVLVHRYLDIEPAVPHDSMVSILDDGPAFVVQIRAALPRLQTNSAKGL